MIYDFFPNYGKEDDYEVEYYEDEDDYNYFLDKTKSYCDCNINKYRKKIFEIRGNELLKFNDKVIVRNESEFYIVDMETEKIISHLIFNKYSFERLIQYNNKTYCIIDGNIHFMDMKIGKINYNKQDIEYSIEDVLFFKENIIFLLST